MEYYIISKKYTFNAQCTGHSPGPIFNVIILHATCTTQHLLTCMN